MTVGPGLPPDPAVQDRSAQYNLLGRLCLEGVTVDLFPLLDSHPFFHAHLSQPVDWDAHAAAHYQLFGFYLHPFESIFRDPAGLVGGPFTNAVIQTYHRAGFSAPAGLLTADVSADHIGQELSFLAFLGREETRARDAKDQKTADQHRQAQFSFIDNHLACWLPPFVLALQKQEDSLFAASGNWLLGLLGSHVVELSEQGFTPAGFALPEPPALLDNPRTGLKEIAEYLVTPPYGGFYLGKQDIGALARRFDLPRGFGDRRQMLTNLFHAAGQYDRLPVLLQYLEDDVTAGEQVYQKMANAFPALATYIAPWQIRLTQTRSLLETMHAAIL